MHGFRELKDFCSEKPLHLELFVNFYWDMMWTHLLCPTISKILPFLSSNKKRKDVAPLWSVVDLLVSGGTWIVCGLMALDKLISEEWLWSSAPAMQHIKQDTIMSVFEAVSFKCRMFAKWVLKSNLLSPRFIFIFLFWQKKPQVALCCCFFTMQTHQLQAKIKPNSLKGV